MTAGTAVCCALMFVLFCLQSDDDGDGTEWGVGSEHAYSKDSDIDSEDSATISDDDSEATEDEDVGGEQAAQEPPRTGERPVRAAPGTASQPAAGTSAAGAHLGYLEVLSLGSLL